MLCCQKEQYFCKICYSRAYYRLHRKDILEKTRRKYIDKENKKPPYFIKQNGKFILLFD